MGGHQRPERNPRTANPGSGCETITRPQWHAQPAELHFRTLTPLAGAELRTPYGPRS
jgi:hypothetical protein